MTGKLPPDEPRDEQEVAAAAAELRERLGLDREVLALTAMELTSLGDQLAQEAEALTAKATLARTRSTACRQGALGLLTWAGIVQPK